MSQASEAGSGPPGKPPRPLSGSGGPLVVWAFFLAYWAATSFLTRGSSTSQLPSSLTPGVALQLVGSVLLEYGPVLLFLFLFVGFYEKRQRSGLRGLLASVGWTGAGAGKSLKWAVIFFVVAIPVGLVMLGVESAVAGAGAEHPAGGSSSTATPSWYFPFVIATLLADVVTEETLMRGYVLDRLMPAHPSTLKGSLKPILATSVMMSSYHIVPYLYTYGFAAPLTGVNLVADFLYSTLIGLAYVKSGARSVSGPVLFHFLLDVPMILV